MEASIIGGDLASHCDPGKVRNFQELSMEWWSSEGRHYLPWRNTADTYHILVAEFLLQKTNAEKVVPVYDQFIIRFPTVFALAGAEVDDLKQILRPLGLYYRSIRLRVVAQTIVDKYGGQVPDTLEQLNELPGVGDYIANAILCFAFRQKKPLIDTNSARILGRVWGFPIPRRPRTDRELWSNASCLVPNDTPREYNFALIDLAHLVCTSRNPRHDICPLANLCVFFQEEVMERDRRNSGSQRSQK